MLDITYLLKHQKDLELINTDDANSGTTGGGSWDFALTTDSLMDGLSVGAGYGKIANGAQTDAKW